MTRNLSMVMAALLGGIVVGVVVWFAKPAVMPSVTKPATVAAPVPAGTVAAPLATSVGQAAPPPWANAGTSGAQAPGLGAAIHGAPVDPAKAQAREALRTRLLGLTAGGRHPTPAEMNDILGDLQRVEGSSTIGGVDIAALRNNLVKVNEMQQLGAELTAQTQLPGGGDKQKIQQLLTRVRQLQSEMQLNVAVAPPAAVPRK
jgi:hypothetical protein